MTTMTTNSAKTFQRLPLTVKPINYQTKLTPDIEKTFLFTGESHIEVEVSETTDKIVLNSAELAIDSVSFVSAISDKAVSAKVHLDEVEERATFSFSEQLPTGKGTLSFNFTGTLNDKLKGFYRSKFKTPSGEERYHAVTHFEPTSARRAFPCWDEPAIRATFDITIVAPKNKVTLSNMPVKSEKVCGDVKVVEFDRTPPMSTYLIAFAVGEFDFIETKDANGVLIRVYTPVGKASEGRFALDVAAKALPFYKDYFGVGYSLPKCDLIAIPDFVINAMENWGLVTFRETALLVDAERTPMQNKQRVGIVVTHELAHKWFGNYVTIKWWTHLWLKEGYATWISYLCLDHIFPEWTIWTSFLAVEYARAMQLDALKSSHPIEVTVENPNQCAEIFDAISYSKGASIIRMLHDYIGDGAFRRGMNLYLKRHQYGSAETTDLWNALGEASGKDIAKVMNAFTGQMGFPVLHVEESDAGFILRQEKFNADGSRDTSFCWPVPVTAVRQKATGHYIEHLFDVQEGKVGCEAARLQAGEWVKFNAGTVGFYRVRYSADLLRRLANSIREQSLSAPDRLGLVADLFALCRAGFDVTISQLLDFLFNFTNGNEADFSVWEEIAAAHSAVSLLIQHTKHVDAFKAYTRRLFGPTAHRLGWDPRPTDGTSDALLRSLALSKMGMAGDADVIAEAKRRFEAHIGKTALLPADLRLTVYTIVAKFGDEKTFQDMLALYRSADMNEERVRLLQAMGRHELPAIRERFLQWALTAEVRSQDTFIAFDSVTGSTEGRVAVWTFAKQNWVLLTERYKGTVMMGRILALVVGNFYSKDAAADLQLFFNANRVDSAQRSMEQSFERIMIQSAWLERESNGLDIYFQ